MRRILQVLNQLRGTPPAPRRNPSRNKSRREVRMEAIRQAMLGCLVSLPKGAVQAIVVRIRHASDPDSLWYLRSDLLHVLASEKGEMVARDYVNTITPLFEGLLPASLLQSTREER